MRSLVFVGLITTLALATHQHPPAVLPAPNGFPTYPQIARNAHIEGDVRVAFKVTSDGRTTAVKAVSGHPMKLVSAWVFDSSPYGSHSADDEHVANFHFKFGSEAKVSYSDFLNITIQSTPGECDHCPSK